MKKIFIITLLLVSKALFAQDLSFSKPGRTFYQELPDPAKTVTAEWAKVRNEINVSYASDNVRYPKNAVPAISYQENWNATAWRGEKIHTQILVWTKKDISGLRFQVKDLVNEKGNRITAENIKAAFVRYVMADEFGGGCNHRKSTDYDSSLVADPIDIIDAIPVKANTVQPIWLSIQVPGEINAGKYTGTIIIDAVQKVELKISLNVLNHLLPPPGEWTYDLDLWQYPAPIARIHDVKLWSDEHFALMRPYYVALANAGQKVISSNIINQPWGNTHVHFDDPTLVDWVKKKDGTWTYDFSKFDRYISFVMSCGIKQRISCYSMVTWNLFFSYFDEASGKETSIKLTPGSPEYTDFWMPMLKKFTLHLKEKGWFNITSIAMDERPMESMKAAIALLKQIDPGWKLALAGDYHPEIEKDIYDYCIASALKFDATVLSRRKAQGMPSTYYTACEERHPGPYSFAETIRVQVDRLQHELALHYTTKWSESVRGQWQQMQQDSESWGNLLGSFIAAQTEKTLVNIQAPELPMAYDVDGMKESLNRRLQDILTGILQLKLSGLPSSELSDIGLAGFVDSIKVSDMPSKIDFLALKNTMKWSVDIAETVQDTVQGARDQIISMGQGLSYEGASDVPLEQAQSPNIASPLGGVFPVSATNFEVPSLSLKPFSESHDFAHTALETMSSGQADIPGFGKVDPLTQEPNSLLDILAEYHDGK